MIVVSVWSPKGGVGKTTIATNLAAAFVSSGKNVLVCDTDEQQSSYNLYTKGEVDFDCMVGVPDDKPDYDVVIIDHAPGHTARPKSAFVVLPLRPSKIDYDSFKKSADLLAGKRYIPLVNQVDYRNSEEATFARNFSKQGAFIIKRRSIYPRAYGEGGTVFDMARKYGAIEARKEMKQLVELINELGN